MTVTLHSMTEDNLKICSELSITKEESHLSMLPEILDEVLNDDARVSMTIYSEETMVGFADHSPLAKLGLYKIHYFLVDKQHRRCGYAEAALQLLIAELCEKPDYRLIMLR